MSPRCTPASVAAGADLISTGPVPISGEGEFAGCTVLYLRDPDGNVIELIERPSRRRSRPVCRKPRGVASAPDDALRWARRLAAARDADGVLTALAEAVHDVLGMTVAVNVRRPADDRFEVTLVIGGGEEAAAPGRRGVRGGDVPRRLRPGAPAAGRDLPGAARLAVLGPVRGPGGDRAGRGARRARRLAARRHARPGPARPAGRDHGGGRRRRSGRRPRPERRSSSRVVALLAAHAASALEAALASSDAADGQREAEELQHLSLSLAAGLDEAEILGRAAEGLATACGWAFVAVGLFDHDRGLLRCVAGAGEGRRLTGRTMPLELAQRAMIAEHRVSESYLLPMEAIGEIVDLNLHRSSHNGEGARGWRRHTLLLPLATGAGEMLGFVWVDDPIDRQLPSMDGRAADGAVRAAGGAARPERAAAGRRARAGHARSAHRPRERPRLRGRAGRRRRRLLARAARRRPVQAGQRPVRATCAATSCCACWPSSCPAGCRRPPGRSGSAATSSPCCRRR